MPYADRGGAPGSGGVVLKLPPKLPSYKLDDWVRCDVSKLSTAEVSRGGAEFMAACTTWRVTGRLGQAMTYMPLSKVRRGIRLCFCGAADTSQHTGDSGCIGIEEISTTLCLVHSMISDHKVYADGLVTRTTPCHE